MKIFRCKWCIRRIGRPSFYTVDGLSVAPPDIAESQISDGICPVCRDIALSELTDRRQQLPTEQTGRAI